MHVSEKLQVINAYESEVRGYCRAFPTIFNKAKGHTLFASDGLTYIDFFAGAGTLNYGHNNDRFKAKLLEYIEQDGPCHMLDMATEAKAHFLTRFNDVILTPRNLRYKTQFPGPTGTNAVESALKLARKVTGRQNIITFHNAYHGMTLGSLAVSGNLGNRAGAGVNLNHSIFMPFDGGLGEDLDSLNYLEKVLLNSSSGIELPAAIILETIQAEGGVNVASIEWLQRLETIARRFDILLIVDDIQVGCGRTGPFFSFEPAGIQPDMVCLSKSLSGFGLPMALVLIRPELDVWKPGEHNGTFRGNNHAFVTATEALTYWEDDALKDSVFEKENRIKAWYRDFDAEFSQVNCQLRGRGLIQGIAFEDISLAGRISGAAFERQLIIETAGPKSQVLKLLPSLTIDMDALELGLDVISQATRTALQA